MPDVHPARPQGGGLAAAFERLRADLRRERIDARSAAFEDGGLEAEFQRQLVDAEGPALKIMSLAAVLIWHAFIFLDLTTITQNLAGVLAIRCLVVGPMMILIAFAIWSGRCKQWFGELAAAAMFVSALGIVAMIGLMPGDGAPPYLIGVLVIFAYGSFFSRIGFPLAAAVYLTVTSIYVAMVTLTGDFRSVDVVSGVAFMASICGMAVLTHYFQEIRARQIWLRNRQRAQDAAYIEELLIEATAADQSKLNFISMLSHELRTPLHQIIGFSEIIRGDPGEAAGGQATRFAEDIRSSAHDLLAQIGKMLRFADTTAGRISYDPERINVFELLDAALKPYRAAAAAKAVVVGVEDVAPARVFADHHHTCFAIGQIIDNALKASPRDGRVIISGASIGEAYELEIRDFGAGMSETEIAAAFEPFAQNEKLRTRSFNGLGLGLTLARKIFSDQGIELRLAAAEGGGLRATMRLPLACAAKSAA
jgi:signal transduction histidine kinase